ncbi:MAG TPA: class I SAM-dependent methyltransferase [Gaiellaceae bacterium]|nr:class I SAM-dependent methyltransferase [Gaiellaceae bacterium]
MSERLEALGRRFARLATRAVVARPSLWPLFRGPLRVQFDRLAPSWDDRRALDALAPLEAALERLDREPRRVLDVGTGTGKGARLVALRFPEAEVTGIDLSPAMVAEAQSLLPAELAGRVRFQVGDASAVPNENGAFDLVVLLNMIPFFAELARVTAPGGTVVIVGSAGPETPMYTPWGTLRRELARAGFEGFEELTAGEGDAFLARRRGPG